MSTNLAVVELRPAPLKAGGRPTAIVPQSMEEAYRLANAVCVAGMAPRGLDTPEKAMVAIMHGLEVGLTPMAALQRIAVVNGRPTIWGDGAIGLVRGSGACEFIHESIAGEGDAMVATCEAKRKGEDAPIVGTFSVADAKKASLWGKQGPWQQFPKRMLQMRARAFALRDGFADVLGGLYLREEIEDDARETRRAPPPAPVEPAAAIEHKPVVEVAQIAPGAAAAIKDVADKVADRIMEKRRAPPPPAAQPAEAKRPTIDLAEFRRVLREAPTIDAANAVYDLWIAKASAPLTSDEQDEADAIMREVNAKFWRDDKWISE